MSESARFMRRRRTPHARYLFSSAQILSPGELAQYQAAEDQNRALLTFWVLKEAAAKMSGEGLRGYPDHTNFALTDPRVTEIDNCLVAVITEGGHHAF